MRTPSVWLLPDKRQLSIRFSQQSNTDAGVEVPKEIPLRIWTHLAFTFYNATKIQAGPAETTTAVTSSNNDGINNHISGLSSEFQIACYIDGRVALKVTSSEMVLSNQGDLYIGRDPWMQGPKSLMTSVRVFGKALVMEEVIHEMSKKVNHLKQRTAQDKNKQDKEDGQRRQEDDDQHGKGEHEDAAKHVAGLLFTSMFDSKEEEDTGAGAGAGDLATTTGTTTTMGSAIGTSSVVDEDAQLIFDEAMVLLGECKELDHSMSLLLSAGDMGHAEALYVAGTVLLHGPSAHASDNSICHELSASSVLNFELYSSNQRKQGTSSGGGSVQGEELRSAGRFRRAFALLSRSASLGYGGALPKLAVMQSGGVGSSNLMAKRHGDPHTSLGLHHLAAVHGDTTSQLALAHRYHKGLGVMNDCETAAYYYSAVADKSHEEHHRGGAEQVHEHKRLTAKEEDEGTIDDGERGDEDERIRFQMMRADEGHLPSIVAMGDLFYYGSRGLARDQVRAREYFRRAADTPYHDTAGQVGIGNMLLKGEGGAKNLTEAMEWYKMAADKNSTRALNGLGYLYFHGDADGGLEKNTTKAFDMFHRAASVKNTDGDSLFNTGHCYWEGVGVEQDLNIAVSYFQRAANDFGHFGSIHKMGKALLDGNGVERSCKQSLKYLVPAARHGSWGNVVRRGFNRYLAGDMQGALVRYLQGGEMGYEVAHSNVGYLLDHNKMSQREIWELFPVTTLVKHHTQDETEDHTTALDNDFAVPVVAAVNNDKDDISKTLAFHFYTLAQSMGSNDNDLRLGDFHYYGYGNVLKNRKEAVKYYRLASSAGSAEAAYSLAVMYADGELTASGDVPPSSVDNTETTTVKNKDKDSKRYPGPAEDMLATKYFQRCLELDPSTEVRVAVELAIGRIWARREVKRWNLWWIRISKVPLLTTSLENWLVSFFVVCLVIVLLKLYSQQQQLQQQEQPLVIAAFNVDVEIEQDVQNVENEIESPEYAVSCREDDEKIQQMVSAQLTWLRQYQATLRHAAAAATTNITQFSRPFHNTAAKRCEEYTLTKQHFKKEALRRFMARQRRESFTQKKQGHTRMIIITGPSGCGKSTLSNGMANSIPGGAIVLKQDSYFTQDFLPYEDRLEHLEVADLFEGPTTIDFQKLEADLKTAAENYPLVIVEGHMVATNAQLRALCDGCVIFRSNEGISKQRRLDRIPDRSPKQRKILSDYYDRYVWKFHQKYAIPACALLRQECEQRNVPVLEILHDDSTLDDILVRVRATLRLA